MIKEHELLLKAHNKIVQGEQLVDKAEKEKFQCEHIVKITEVINEKYADCSLDEIDIDYDDYPENSPYNSNRRAIKEENKRKYFEKCETTKTILKWSKFAVALLLTVILMVSGVLTVTNLKFDFVSIIVMVLIYAVMVFIVWLIFLLIKPLIFSKILKHIIKKSVPAYREAFVQDNENLKNDILNAEAIFKQYRIDCDLITKTLNDVRALDILPEEYIDSAMTERLLQLFQAKEVDTIKEAIQTYKRKVEEERRHQEMMAQQNEQFNVMKNIALQQLSETERLNQSIVEVGSEVKKLKSAVENIDTSSGLSHDQYWGIREDLRKIRDNL